MTLPNVKMTAVKFWMERNPGAGPAVFVSPPCTASTPRCTFHLDPVGTAGTSPAPPDCPAESPEHTGRGHWCNTLSV